MDQFNHSFQQAQFILRYLRNELTVPEKTSLDEWLAEKESNRTLFEELTNEVLLKKELVFFNEIPVDTAWDKVQDSSTQPVTIIQLQSSRRWWYAAAAVLVLLGAFSLYQFKVKEKAKIAVAESSIQKNDIAPGGNKAVLTLANGSTIILDSAANGNLASQGNTKIIKLNGQLAYSADGKDAAIVYNTITTPRGGQYELILADGSKVWLNAASSLRFPVNFTGKERKVALTGEGYFEVAKNATMPFKVDVAGKGEVEVLGTHFNINAYTDEPTINTTLLEGSVKFFTTISGEQKEVRLSPGQQAQLKLNGQINLNDHPDMDEVMAWKNGEFQFNSADLKSIMRQIERWYDVDVIFNSQTDLHLSGQITRYANVSEVLRKLELTNEIHFTIEGKKIIVH